MPSDQASVEGSGDSRVRFTHSRSYLVVDSQMQYGVISLYNTTAKHLEKEVKFGSEVLIARPNKIEVLLTRDEKIYLYEAVRVTNLGMMFVDGKPLSDKGQPMSVVS